MISALLVSFLTLATAEVRISSNGRVKIVKHHIMIAFTHFIDVEIESDVE